MTTLYAVNAGSYSDYRVVAIFDNRESAELFMKLNPVDRYDGYNDIEEYTLNPGEAEMRQGFSHYWVQMDEDGSTANAPQIQTCGLRREPGEFISNLHNGKRFFNWYGWASTPTHALKSANERRISLLSSPAQRDLSE